MSNEVAPQGKTPTYLRRWHGNVWRMLKNSSRGKFGDLVTKKYGSKSINSITTIVK